jgi:hypothetical protein
LFIIGHVLVVATVESTLPEVAVNKPSLKEWRCYFNSVLVQ